MNGGPSKNMMGFAALYPSYDGPPCDDVPVH